jgi:cytochrome P450 family 6
MPLDWDQAIVLDQFLNETMRLHGIANNVFRRECVKNHKLGDVKIKKGTCLFYAANSLHRDPEYFNDVEKFDITRFEPAKMSKMPKKTFIPFSEGSRMCSGVYLGQVMTKSVIVSLLALFEVEKDPEFDALWLLTLSLEMPTIKLRLRPRQF